MALEIPLKTYTTPRLTSLGTVEGLTLVAGGNHPSGVGVNWIKPGSSNDPGGAGLAVKVKN